MKVAISVGSKKDKRSLLLVGVLFQLVSSSLCQGIGLTAKVQQMFSRVKTDDRTKLQKDIAVHLKVGTTLQYHYCSFDWQTNIQQKDVFNLSQKTEPITFGDVKKNLKLWSGLEHASLDGELFSLDFTPVFNFFDDKPSFMMGNVLLTKTDPKTKQVEYLKITMSFQLHFDPQYHVWDAEHCNEYHVWGFVPTLGIFGILLDNLIPIRNCNTTHEKTQIGYTQEIKNFVERHFKLLVVDSMARGLSHNRLQQGQNLGCQDLDIITGMPK